MQDVTLVHSTAFPLDLYLEALEPLGLTTRAIAALDELTADPDHPEVVLLDSVFSEVGAVRGHRNRAFLALGVKEGPESDDRIYLSLPASPAPVVLTSAIRRAGQAVQQEARSQLLESELLERNRELEEINQIGVALSTLRNHDLLLEMILTKSRELSRSDAGSLYLLDDIPEKGQVLRWKLAQNDSIEVDFEEKILTVTKQSLAGYVALTGETLVIDDAYDLPANVEYTINRSFDLATGYLTKSMLVLPMANHEGDTIGVIQLLNRKRDGAPSKLSAATVPDSVVAFDEQTISLMRSLAGQAAVAVENNLLYDSIEKLFEGFVTASVTAIEQRDPTTSGHSFRVAGLTVELARTVDSVEFSPFTNVSFTPDQVREIRYASLLHDFGKVGVREKVLVKEKKLYPQQLELLRYRFDYAIKALEADFMERKIALLLEGRSDSSDELAELEAEMKRQIELVENDFAFVSRSNEPTVLPEGDFQYLQELAEREYLDLKGERRKLLTPEEVKILSIRKGNLDALEREEIESHVTHTFRFLSKIPWTKDLRHVPELAYSHHEKMNGRGYPRGIPASAIPIQSRMMTVSDIYDALTAKDRPYKRAISTERALDILNMEVEAGLLDSPIVQLFIEAKVYEKAGILRT